MGEATQKIIDCLRTTIYTADLKIYYYCYGCFCYFHFLLLNIWYAFICFLFSIWRAMKLPQMYIMHSKGLKLMTLEKVGLPFLCLLFVHPFTCISICLGFCSYPLYLSYWFLIKKQNKSNDLKHVLMTFRKSFRVINSLS